MNRQLLLGYFYAAAGSALFSTKAIFIKLAYMDKVDAALMLALRMMTALPFFLGVAIYVTWKMKREGKPMPPRRVWIMAIVIGFIGYYLSALLDFEGLVYITAQLERLVLFTYPVMVMVLGWLFFKGRITWMGCVGAAVTYAGLIVVFLKALPEGGHDTILGTSLVLACAFTFAVYQLLAKNYISVMGSLLFTGVALTSSAVACIIHYIVVSGGFDFSATHRFYWLAAGCGFFATVLPSFMVNAGLSRTSVQASSMIASISPIVTIVLAVAILGEKFELVDAIGSAMVIVGIVIFAVTDKRPVSEQKETNPVDIEAA
ncbi:DMT family transporter [Aestuariivirga litoralis]|uniref:DMT family transporter n=1 Tax=Aestuariivirga litoralis TaxID=2650924 RepID=UPI0018C7CF4A|nr:DMT family transporter [Aestuariivirga litoralis]